MKDCLQTLLNKGFRIIYEEEESKSFIYLNKRDDSDHLLDSIVVCNLSVWDKHKQQPVDCNYTSSRVYNMERHIKAGKHYHWRRLKDIGENVSETSIPVTSSAEIDPSLCDSYQNSK